MSKIPTSVELLDLARAAIGSRLGLDHPVSDYKAANELGITRAAVSKVRGGKTFGDGTVAKLAELLKVDPRWLLACVQAERAQNVGLRRLWQEAAHKLAISLFCVAIFAGLMPEQAHAAGMSQLYTLCALLGGWWFASLGALQAVPRPFLRGVLGSMRAGCCQGEQEHATAPLTCPS